MTATQAAEVQAASPARSHRRTWIWALVIALVLIAAAYTAVRIVQAARQGSEGRASLLSAESALKNRDVKRAERLLQRAHAQFAKMHSDLDALGPLLPISKVIPLVRTQVRAAQTMASVGEELSTAGIDVARTSDGLLHPAHPHLPLAQAVGDLKNVNAAAQHAVGVLDDAARRMSKLDGYRLLGPLASARDQLESRLGKAQTRGHELANGLTVLLDVVGANGPRRYLVLTQNPDEVRPTGGYIGTYGLIVADGGHVKLTEYGPSGAWSAAHPKAQIPAAKAPFVFEYATPPQPQTLSNVNTGPEWASAAQLAAKLWAMGGEKPVDGVISMEPQVIAAMVKVYGSVRVPAYGETVTAANVQSRIDYYAHGEASRGKTDVQRKDFIAELAHAVLQRTLSATGSEWMSAATALQSTFAAREGMAWSAHASVQKAVVGLSWAGSLPSVGGDFYADDEFEFAAKNGSAIRRTFDHRVTLRPDGSGISATAMTLTDTQPAARSVNDDTLSYITPYGPIGAMLDPFSDKPQNDEPTVSGHPAEGWVRTAQPMGSTTLRVVWRVPQLLTRIDQHHWIYSLMWLPQPGHRHDQLKLAISLPQGWAWRAGRPPAVLALDGPFAASWEISAP